MKKIGLNLIWILAFLLIFSGCAMLEDILSADELPLDTKPPMMVDVMLQEAEGLTVVGENPIRVEAGSDVSFAVEIQDGYKIEEIGQGASYADGMITLSAVKFPTTVEVETRVLNNLSVTVHNN